MAKKTYVPQGCEPPLSQVGATLEALSATIAARRSADEGSYTYRLLSGNVDKVLKSLMEESGEVALAAKDVESWACSSMAASLGYDLAQGKSAPDDRLDIGLPAEYDEAIDHLRYEAADVVYHLLVVLERYGITLDEFAAELNNRMTEHERPQGGIRLFDEYVKRGK